MTGAFIAGAENEILPLMVRKEVPLIGPFTLYPQTVPLNRQVFYLLSGANEQARALVHFIARKPEFRNAGVAVVYAPSEPNAGVVAALKDQIRKDGLNGPQVYDYIAGSLDAADKAKQLKLAGRDVIFFLGNGEETLSLMREADKLNWFPTILLPGAGLGADIFGAPAGFNGKVFLSFPNAPADQTSEGINEFRALAEKYKLPTKHVASQTVAYGAAKVLVEGLKRAGKDLSRAKLILALEGLSGYPTGLTPPVTYGPNRRVGAMGAYVITIDLKEKNFLPASGWINLN